MVDDGDTKAYLDSSQSVEQRVTDLIGRMTLTEKVGQLSGTVASDVDAIETAIKEDSIGTASPFGHSASPYDTPEKAATVANRLQRVAVEQTRLGIPLLFYVDAVHGHARLKSCTVFPHNLGLAATRDPDLVADVGRVTAEEVAATGGHQSNDPVCDVARDPRWGRTFETFGESPLLCGRFGAAKVSGYAQATTEQGIGVISTPKHFPAYSEPRRGQDGAPVEVSEYTLRTTFLPPFTAAIDAGARAIMPAYNSIDGEPIHGSTRYLSTLLREELDFDGHVVSDWGGIAMLHENHRTAETMADAYRQALEAGIDLASAGGSEFVRAVVKMVEDGELSESSIDEKTRRILRSKVQLGLFEEPYVNVEEASRQTGSNRALATARKTARKSITLLKNDGVLPLSDSLDEILVTGPNADSIEHQIGGWSSATHPPSDGTTVREGIATQAGPSTEVTYTRGAGISERDNLDRAKHLASAADAAVVVLGESAYIHEFSEPSVHARELHETNDDAEASSFPTRTKLSLPPAQRELVKSVHETGTPTVVVLITGRPLAIDWCAQHVPGILMAYYPGMFGGRAVAEVIFGSYNPSGKLPISFPRSAGHLPTRFNHLPHPTTAGSDQHPGSYEPLFPFGHGLSYTTFEYRDLALSDGSIRPEESITASVTVINDGPVAGTESVDLYLTDCYSSRVTPNRRVVGFDSVDLGVGEEKTVSFEVGPTELGILRDGGRVVEPGTFELAVGELTAEFAVE